MKAYKKQIELVKRQTKPNPIPQATTETSTRREMTPDREARIRFMQNIVADARVRG